MLSMCFIIFLRKEIITAAVKHRDCCESKYKLPTFSLKIIRVNQQRAALIHTSLAKVLPHPLHYRIVLQLFFEIISVRLKEKCILDYCTVGTKTE